MSGGFHQPSAKGTLHTQRNVKRNGESRGYINHGAEIQNVKSSRVYVFGENDVEEEEINQDEIELSELRPRGKALRDQKQNGPETQEECYFEREISEEDSIRTIALKYGCQVAELKTLNKLIRDQDFYALKTIKVPVKRFGLLTELIEEENKNNDGAKLSLKPGASGESVIEISEANGDVTDYGEDSDTSESRQLLVRTLSIRDSMVSSQGKEAIDFLKKMDSDIKGILKGTKNSKDTLEEVTASLTTKRIQPLKGPNRILGGADCGIRWWNVVITMFVIGVLTPILIFAIHEFIKFN